MLISVMNSIHFLFIIVSLLINRSFDCKGNSKSQLVQTFSQLLFCFCDHSAKLRRISCASKFVTKKLFLRLHVTNSTQDDWCLPQALVSLRGSDTCLYERVEQAFMKDTPQCFRKRQFGIVNFVNCQFCKSRVHRYARITRIINI